MRISLGKPVSLLQLHRTARPASPRPSPLAVGARVLLHYCDHRVALVLLALAVVLTAVAPFLNHMGAAWLSPRIPISWVQIASTRTLAHLDSTLLIASKLPASRQRGINTQFAALRVPLAEPPLYELIFRHGGVLGARSFTLAGGQIVITDEWILQFGNDVDLIAALAEQLGHLQNRNALRRAVEAAPMSILLAVFRSDAPTGIRLLSDTRTISSSTERDDKFAKDFSRRVMRINPQLLAAPKA